MPPDIPAVRVFNPRVIRRDGLDFTATIDGTDRPCFISGTAIAILAGDIQGDMETVFNARWSEVAIVISRKAGSTPADQEITIGSADVRKPD